jgi:murein DD-endopeptidase MepM/ murein hydrolase activator NlpD
MKSFLSPLFFILLILLAGITLNSCETTSQAPAVMKVTPTSALATPPPISTLSSELMLEMNVPGEAAPTPLQVSFPTTVPASELAWRPPPYSVPWAIRPEDHFYLFRPIPSGEVNWPLPDFRYGSTYFGEEAVHTGVDLGARRGATVLAAGTGEVVWAGYGLYRGKLDDKSDPYGLAIAIRHDFGYRGQMLYTVYAHMQSMLVWEGQRVEMGEPIGKVGSTGHSEGPHLHFEVRVGENRYYTTRNPELWMVPPEGWAVLAGSVLNTYGRRIPEQLVRIQSVETNKRWNVWTYAEETIHPDDVYGENFVISDLPAGPYKITIDAFGLSYTAYMYLYPGQTNFFVFRGRDGYIIEPTPSTVDLSKPPDL